jgi:hypothetical protein
LKNPPLQSIHMLCNTEWNPYGCNGGFVYVQNVRPDGPVSWVFKEVAWNLLRRADDHYEYLSQWTKRSENCQSFDQSWIDDAVMSATAGLRISDSLVHRCKLDKNFTGVKGNLLTAGQVKHLQGQFLQHRHKIIDSFPIPDTLIKSMSGLMLEVPKEDRLLLYGNLTVPNLKYGFPEELGGRQWPDGPPGNLSSDFEQMLKSDCPHCAWWPEERPTIPQELFHEILSRTDIDKTTASIFIDPSIAPEVFGKSPNWFASPLLHARKGTTFGLHAVKQGYPAIGHIFAMEIHDMLYKVCGSGAILNSHLTPMTLS